MVNGALPGPAPADQARASSSRLTRSSWRTCPHRKLRRKVPSVDGALTTQPKVRLFRRCATRRRRRCSRRQPAPTPPGSGSCRQRWLGPEHDPSQRGGPTVHRDQDDGPASPEGAAQHWPPDGDRQRQRGCGRAAGYTQRHAQTWLPLVRYDSTRSRSFLLTFKTVAFRCSSFRMGFLCQKPLSPKRGSTFSFPQRTATLIFSVDWG